MLNLISDILKADYGCYDFFNVISGTLLHLVTAVRTVLSPWTIYTDWEFKTLLQGAELSVSFY